MLSVKARVGLAVGFVVAANVAWLTVGSTWYGKFKARGEQREHYRKEIAEGKKLVKLIERLPYAKWPKAGAATVNFNNSRQGNSVVWVADGKLDHASAVSVPRGPFAASTGLAKVFYINRDSSEDRNRIKMVTDGETSVLPFNGQNTPCMGFDEKTNRLILPSSSGEGMIADLTTMKTKPFSGEVDGSCTYVPDMSLFVTITNRYNRRGEESGIVLRAMNLKGGTSPLPAPKPSLPARWFSQGRGNQTVLAAGTKLLLRAQFEPTIAIREDGGDYPQVERKSLLTTLLIDLKTGKVSRLREP